MLLLVFADLKSEVGPVTNELISFGADEEDLATWRELVQQEIKKPDADDEFD
jgi:hypothetical protein